MRREDSLAVFQREEAEKSRRHNWQTLIVSIAGVAVSIGGLLLAAYQMNRPVDRPAPIVIPAPVVNVPEMPAPIVNVQVPPTDQSEASMP